MIIRKKKYKEILKENEMLKKQLVEEITRQQKITSYYSSLKETDLEKRLKEYKYVILVDEDNEVRLFNQGRWEREVMAIEFDVALGEIPTIQIIK